MTPEARRAPDTDWWMSKLYGPIAEALDASLIVPTHSRYVDDLNRPPDDVSLYPGQNTTGLCPAVRFSGDPVYLDGQGPDGDEIAKRVEAYWRPYHEALSAELARLRGRHGRVLLWEGHSIASTVPFLFEGELPELNVGTAAGASCHHRTEAALRGVLDAQSRFSWVLNGRFKGGYITRHYGRPSEGVEAVQLETAQRAYMDEPAGGFDPARAAPLQAQVRALIEAALAA
jgi:N-formylglutamate deformylase